MSQQKIDIFYPQIMEGRQNKKNWKPKQQFNFSGGAKILGEALP